MGPSDANEVGVGSSSSVRSVCLRLYEQRNVCLLVLRYVVLPFCCPFGERTYSGTRGGTQTCCCAVSSVSSVLRLCCVEVYDVQGAGLLYSDSSRFLLVPPLFTILYMSGVFCFTCVSLFARRMLSQLAYVARTKLLSGILILVFHLSLGAVGVHLLMPIVDHGNWSRHVLHSYVESETEGGAG